MTESKLPEYRMYTARTLTGAVIFVDGKPVDESEWPLSVMFESHKAALEAWIASE